MQGASQATASATAVIATKAPSHPNHEPAKTHDGLSASPPPSLLAAIAMDPKPWRRADCG